MVDISHSLFKSSEKDVFRRQGSLTTRNYAGVVNHDGFDQAYYDLYHNYSGEFKFSEKDADFYVGTSVVTESSVVTWNRSFTDFMEGDLPILREILMENSEHVYTLLDELDLKYKELVPNPTEHFRVWLKNEFHWPDMGSITVLGNNEEFDDIDKKRAKKMSKLMKDQVHPIKDMKERSRVFKEVRNKLKVEVSREVEEHTRYYREHFGGSRKHSCLYCFLNHPCHCCGHEYPVQKFMEVDIDGDFRSHTKDGLERAGVWNWRCGSAMLQEVGMHICHACAVRNMVHRSRGVVQKRKDMTLYAEAQKELSDAQHHLDHTTLNPKIKEEKKQIAKLKRNVKTLTGKVEKKKIKGEKPLYPKIAVVGGAFKRSYVQLRIEQGGKPVEEQSPDCKDPIIQKFMWIKEGVEDIEVTHRIPGKDGVKKTNGCWKSNRKRIKEDKAAMAEIERALKEMAAKKEAEQRKQDLLEYKKKEDKDFYIQTEARTRFQKWVTEEGPKYSSTLCRQTELRMALDDCYGNTYSDYERAVQEFRRGELCEFQNKLQNRINKFDTIQDYIKKEEEDANDMRKYGKIIDVSKVIEGLEAAEEKQNRGIKRARKEADPEKVKQLSALDRTIAEQKRKMALTRAAYEAKKQKCS